MNTVNKIQEDSNILEALPEAQVHQLLSNHCVGSLGYIAHNTPYVIPVTYYYNREAHCLISYAGEGHKISSLRENPQVSLLVYHKESMTMWRSVLVHGIFEELHQLEAKYHLKRFSDGVREILTKQGVKTMDFLQQFSSKGSAKDIPIVYRIRIEDWTGRRRKG